MFDLFTWFQVGFSTKGSTDIVDMFVSCDIMNNKFCQYTIFKQDHKLASGFFKSFKPYTEHEIQWKMADVYQL